MGRDARVAARVALATIASALCLLLMLAGASIGLSGATALSQPSPSGSPSGSPGGGGDPKIQLLNPAPGYDPQLGQPSRPPGTADPPKISDRFDGFDNAYHIVAAASGVPEGAIAEAYWFRSGTGAIEQTIGAMLLQPGTTDTFETFWDIPTTMADGPITIRARLFKPTPAGFEEIAMDEVVADLQNRGNLSNDNDPHTGPGNSPQTTPQDETVEILYPESGDPLGFFRAKGSGWAAALEGTTSNGTSEMSAFYSKTAPGNEPEFVKCGDDPTFERPESEIDVVPTPEDAPPIPFIMGCTLTGTDKPSQVTAVAIVTEEGDKADRSDVTGFGPGGSDDELTQDSADVHRVASTYIQTPAQMNVDVQTNGTSGAPGQGRRLTGGCMSFLVVVTDHLGRRVQGANVDVHFEGPADDLRFSNLATTEFSSSPFKAPEKSHTNEQGETCNADSPRVNPQAEHNRPGANDTKHMESAGLGTGDPGDGINSGEWRFVLESTTPGFTDITAFVDSPAVTEAAAPEGDDDLLSPGEPSGSYTAQWLPAAIRVTIDPVGRTTAVGTCAQYIARVRAGSPVVPRANVDVHLTGPTDGADFCDPGDASERRAPDAGAHDVEDEFESAHGGTSPRAQHIEGETDSEGNFVFGISSADTGDATITAWYDGDRDQDDDVLSGEASGTATHTWAAAGTGPRINFVNPTPYGTTSVSPPGHPAGANGTQISNKLDSDELFHIVARVDSPDTIPGVEFLIASTADGPFTNLGTASRIGGSDTFELASPVNVADGSYVLRARVVGTSVVKDQSVTVNRATAQADPPPSQQAETLEILRPSNGGPVTFTGTTTRVRGVASAGAEGADLFYTRVGPNVTPAGSDWILCGFVDLSGTGTTPQEFEGDCTLTAGDQAAQVTGIAAITYDCAQAGCNAAVIPPANPNLQPTRNPGQKDTGDAHRVFGVETAPRFALEPAESAGAPGSCRTFVVVVEDQNGQGLHNENVDVHITGPGDDASFCTPADGTGSARSAPDQGGHTADPGESATGVHDGDPTDTRHTEGLTPTDGRFVVGVTSGSVGDSQLVAWLDRNGNDIQDGDEQTDASVMHWEGGSQSECDIEGTEGSETLTGTAAPERICGYGGNDSIIGGGGNDVILGGGGNDTIRGNAGNDTIKGQSGNDRILAGAGRDVAAGGKGRDRIRGHRGNDSLSGNARPDALFGGPGTDTCNGGSGRDRLRSCEAGDRRGFAARRTLI